MSWEGGMTNSNKSMNHDLEDSSLQSGEVAPHSADGRDVCHFDHGLSSVSPRALAGKVWFKGTVFTTIMPMPTRMWEA